MPSLANIYCHGVPSGLTLTGELYPDGSDTTAGTGLTVTEQTNRKATYVLNAGVSGLHLINLKSGSNVVWVGWTPTNLAITGDFEACSTRREALNLDAKISDVPAAVRDVDNSTPAEGSLGAVLNAISSIFNGMTSLANWLRRIVRKDAGTANMGVALSEINAGGGAFAGTTDSPEAIRDRGDAAWTGGGGGPVQASVVVPAASARAVLQGSTIGVTRGDTLRVTFTGLGDLTGRDKLWFTCKQSKSAADAAAIIQIEETGNLTTLNGAAPSSAAWGTLIVIDANAGEVDLLLYAAATSLLTVFDGYVWDVKQSLGSNPDDAATLTEGKLNVEANVTLATS